MWGQCGWWGNYILDRSPAYDRARDRQTIRHMFTLLGKLEWPIHMSLDGGRETEHSEKTYADKKQTCKLYSERLPVELQVTCLL